MIVPPLVVHVTPMGEMILDGEHFSCRLGRSGVVADKVEGDGGTPAGTLVMRRVYYRPDRVPRPTTLLPVIPLEPAMGWCDAPDDPAYNRPITLPYPASAESLWRDDGLYDVFVELGWNDDPVVPGRGSAIFLHRLPDEGRPTAGCVALADGDLAELLARAVPGAVLQIDPPI